MAITFPWEADISPKPNVTPPALQPDAPDKTPPPEEQDPFAQERQQIQESDAQLNPGGPSPMEASNKLTAAQGKTDGGQLGVDVSGGVVRGAENAVLETAKFANKINPVMIAADKMGLNSDAAIDDVPQLDKPTSTAGAISTSISQFTVGMLGLGKLLAPVKFISKLPTLVKVAGESGIVGAVAFDPYEERLSSLVAAHESLAQPIGDFLSADPKDGEVEARAKAFIENAGLGVAGHSLLRVLTGIRLARSLRAEGKPEEAQKAIEDAVSQAAEPATEPAKTDGVVDTAPSTKESGPTADTASGELPNEPVSEADALAPEKAVKYSKDELQTFKDQKVSEAKPNEIPDWESFRSDNNVSNKGTPGIADEAGRRNAEHFRTYVSRGEDGKPQGILKVWMPRKASGDIPADNGFVNVVVAPEFRRQGIATKLYDAAKKDGVDVERLSASTANSVTPEGAAFRQGRLQKQIDGKVDVGVRTVPFNGNSDGGIAPETATPPEPKPILSDADRAKLIEKIRYQNSDEFASIAPYRDPGVDLNLDKYVGEEGAKQAMNDMSDAIAPGLKGVKEVQTLQNIKETASIIGQDQATLAANLGKHAKDAEELAYRVQAGKELLYGTAKQITDHAKIMNIKEANGELSTADQAKMDHLVDFMSNLQSNLKSIITSSARVTSAGRITVDRDMIKLLSMANGDPKAIGKMVEGTVLGKVIGVHNEFWMNAILSSVKTHTVNLSSNLINTLIMPAERLIGGALMGDKQVFREASAQYMGMISSVWDSIRMAAKSFGQEGGVIDAVSKNDAPYAAISAEAGHWYSGAVNGLGKLVRLPSRFLTAEDEFFKQMNFRSKIYSKSYVEGVDKGLKGDALSKYIDENLNKVMDQGGSIKSVEQISADARAAGLMDDAKSAYIKKNLDDVSNAFKYSREATFTQDLEYGIGKGVQDFVYKHPAARLVIPFVRTPTNLMRNVWQHTPGLNLLQKGFQEDIKAGGERAASAWGKMTTGTALWVGAGALAAAGGITGYGPQDPDKRKLLAQTGWQPYSFKAGDTYISFSRLDPYASFFGMAADFADAAGQMEKTDAMHVAGAMGLALAHNFTQKTYLQGLTQALDAAMNPGTKAEKVQAWIRQRAASYVPTAPKQISDATGITYDPYMHEAKSIMDSVKAKIPGLSSTLPPQRNMLGEKMTIPAGLGPDTMSPFGESKALHNDVKDELARLDHGWSKPNDKFGNVQLTPQQYDKYMELHQDLKVNGKTMSDALHEEIQKHSYQRLTDGDQDYNGSKVFVLNTIMGKYHQAAKMKLLNQDTGLRGAVRQDQINRKKAMMIQGLKAPENPGAQ